MTLPVGRRLRIGVDIDGCCYDFPNAVRIWRHIKHGVPLEDMPEAESWSFHKDQWNLSSAEFLSVCAEAVNAGFLYWQGPVFPDALDVISKLYQRHEIVVITDRSLPGAEEACRDATRHWLDKVGLPYHELHFSADKTAFGVDTMVDDKVENVEALLGAEVDAFMMVRRHNYRSHIPADRRVHNWWEFAEKLKGRSLRSA